MSLKYTETVFGVNAHYTGPDIPYTLLTGDYAGMEFCANMKRLRGDRGWNQGDLAERIGVAQATVQRWENGKREPSHADLEKLAVALGVAVADLFRTGPQVDPVPTEPDLAYMIERAMKDLPVGVTYADYPQAVSSSLHDQLMQYQAGGGFRRNEDEESAHSTGAQPPSPTTRPGQGGRRSQ